MFEHSISFPASAALIIYGMLKRKHGSTEWKWNHLETNFRNIWALPTSQNIFFLKEQLGKHYIFGNVLKCLPGTKIELRSNIPKPSLCPLTLALTERCLREDDESRKMSNEGIIWAYLR